MESKTHICRNYSNFGFGQSEIFFPRNNNEIFKILDYTKRSNKKVLCIGSSLSWYDTILNTNNVIINLKNYEKNFSLNEDSNILTVSSSFKIGEILNKLSEKNLSLFSLPGHLDVTIGGCVANDVHGKDTYKNGNFGTNIVSIEIILPNKQVVECSREKNKELFLSTIGGLGLTGVISKISINLKKITNFYETTNFMCANYKELIKSLYYKRNDYDYIYGWVDALSDKENIGRGVIFKSKKNFNTKKTLNTRFYENLFTFLKGLIFSFSIKTNLIKYLNILFFYSHFFNKRSIETYNAITSPLKTSGIDLKKIKLCPPYSFLEVQIILKEETLPESLYEFLNKCQKLKLKGSIVGIKMHKKSSGYLSFSDDGVSININHIFKPQDKKNIISKFKILYDYLIDKNFKINIAKEFFLNKKSFEKNYPSSKNFFLIKQKYDHEQLFSSDFLRRVLRKS